MLEEQQCWENSLHHGRHFFHDPGDCPSSDLLGLEQALCFLSDFLQFLSRHLEEYSTIITRKSNSWAGVSCGALLTLDFLVGKWSQCML